MTSPRLTRLANDYQQLRVRFDGHPSIRVDALGTVPPERYRVTYDMPSLRLDPSSRPVMVQTTVVDFELPMGYPKEKPHAVAHGNVFHPNFGEYVCIADFWSPSQSLADIVLEVGQMLQWQKYNIQSPLNAIAADWAVKHIHELPVGNKDLYSDTNILDLNITKSVLAEEK
jgi:ubiquitin-protein ligase